MANIKETLVIESLGKWGPKANGVYYSYSKNFKDQAKVVPGATLECDIYVADSGKKYVNSILSTTKTEAVAKAHAVPVVPAKPRDFDAEAKGKTRCALFAAALQCPAMAALVTPDDILALAIKLAEEGVKYTFEGR